MQTNVHVAMCLGILVSICVMSVIHVCFGTHVSRTSLARCILEKPFSVVSMRLTICSTNFTKIVNLKNMVVLAWSLMGMVEVGRMLVLVLMEWPLLSIILNPKPGAHGTLLSGALLSIRLAESATWARVRRNETSFIVNFMFCCNGQSEVCGGGTKAEGVGVIKDKELKLEETEACNTLGGAGESRVQVRGEGADATRLSCESK